MILNDLTIDITFRKTNQKFISIQYKKNMNDNNLKEGGDPERLDITFGGTALHAAVASEEDDQARGIIFVIKSMESLYKVGEQRGRPGT